MELFSKKKKITIKSSILIFVLVLNMHLSKFLDIHKQLVPRFVEKNSKSLPNFYESLLDLLNLVELFYNVSQMNFKSCRRNISLEIHYDEKMTTVAILQLHKKLIPNKNYHSNIFEGVPYRGVFENSYEYLLLDIVQTRISLC